MEGVLFCSERFVQSFQLSVQRKLGTAMQVGSVEAYCSTFSMEQCQGHARAERNLHEIFRSHTAFWREIFLIMRMARGGGTKGGIWKPLKTPWLSNQGFFRHFSGIFRASCAMKMHESLTDMPIHMCSLMPEIAKAPYGTSLSSGSVASYLHVCILLLSYVPSLMSLGDKRAVS